MLSEYLAMEKYGTFVAILLQILLLYIYHVIAKLLLDYIVIALKLLGRTTLVSNTGIATTYVIYEV